MLTVVIVLAATISIIAELFLCIHIPYNNTTIETTTILLNVNMPDTNDLVMKYIQHITIVTSSLHNNNIL